MEFFVKQGKRNNWKTAQKHLPKRKNKAKSSQGKEATAVETDGEYVIMRGAITPKEKHKKDRCKDVIGLTISKALNITVENDGGQQVVYTKTDLSNNQKDGFITLTKNRELTTTGQGCARTRRKHCGAFDCLNGADRKGRRSTRGRRHGGGGLLILY